MTELQEVWTGEPIALHHSGDRYRFTWLGQNPRFPGRHVHPAVRQDAEMILKVSSERDALVAEHAAFLAERLAFVQRLRKNPDRTAAVRELQAYDGNVELVASDIPDADQAVVEAWKTLDATIGAVWPEWLAYLRRKGSEAAQRLSETIFGVPTWPLRQVLDEVELIDALIRLEGIKPDRTPSEAADIKANFDRGLRRGSLDRLWNTWELPGDQGDQFGLGALPAIYGSLFKVPEPAPVVEAEDTPMDPDTVDRARITGIPGEIGWTPDA